MPLLHDPNSKELRILREGSMADVDRAVQKMMDEIPNTARQLEKEDRYRVAVVHRRDGVVRWFNFNPRYAGAYDHCWQIIAGKWRFATELEEAQQLVLEDELKEKSRADALRLANLSAERAVERATKNQANLAAIEKRERENSRKLSEAGARASIKRKAAAAAEADIEEV